MENEKLTVKSHPFYHQGYADGHKDGYSKFLEQYQKLLTTSAPREIHIKCDEFTDCPYKKKGAK